MKIEIIQRDEAKRGKYTANIFISIQFDEETEERFKDAVVIEHLRALYHEALKGSGITLWCDKHYWENRIDMCFKHSAKRKPEFRNKDEIMGVLANKFGDLSSSLRRGVLDQVARYDAQIRAQEVLREASHIGKAFLKEAKAKADKEINYCERLQELEDERLEATKRYLAKELKDREGWTYASGEEAMPETQVIVKDHFDDIVEETNVRMVFRSSSGVFVKYHPWFLANVLYHTAKEEK